ncbi:unnamed protein product [Heligmosomoides polygyrus]|uniref:CHK domain-containing protein n=1 Tax=Heligmosomoides polygyrus TaxID=6339 RepID=A0A3P7XC82_HELPZ|nr:unnamed protein product [Heligmosomoides polygyrus]
MWMSIFEIAVGVGTRRHRINADEKNQNSNVKFTNYYYFLRVITNLHRCRAHTDSQALLSLSHLRRPDRKCLVTFQICHFGCSATDLVRLFCACLSAKDRRAHWEELVEDFYGYMKEEVGDRKMPYTLEQLKEAYRSFFPMGAFMIVPMIGPLFEVIFKNSDEEKQKKVSTIERLCEWAQISR